MYCLTFCYIFSLTLLQCFASTDAISKLLGVPISKLPLYKINEPFTCLDGGQSIPWHMVNDDYCDCRDGSDEPGTSACSNGLFYCENKHFQGIYIPSTRVNDHICDCCDGSDEYNSRAKCPNTCWELGKEARERQEENDRVMREGHKLYLDHVREANEKITQHQARLQALKVEVEQANKLKSEFEVAKNDAEAKEKEIRTINEESLAQKKKAWEERQDKRKSVKTFRSFDVNHDGRVDVAEMQSHKAFDIDQNGDVSETEAKEYLKEEDSVDLDAFMKNVWPNIKELVKEDQSKSSEDHQEDSESDGSEKDEELDETEESSTRLKSEEPVEIEGVPPESEDPEPQPDEFNDEAKAIIAEADGAREKYNHAATAVKKLEDEMHSIEGNLHRDYGKDAAFFILAESSDCFSMDDREYTYTLCPFKEVNQKPKHGGSDTNLGRWSRWHQEHSVQLYDNGQGCWNGPARSTKVTLICGLENKLLKVDEPSRCEYTMTFATPTACNEALSEGQQKHVSHEDL